MTDMNNREFNDVERVESPRSDNSSRRERARGRKQEDDDFEFEEQTETRWIVYHVGECIGRRRCLYFCLLLLLLIAAILGITLGLMRLLDDDDEGGKPPPGSSDRAIDPTAPGGGGSPNTFLEDDDFVNEVCSIDSLRVNSAPCIDTCEPFTGCCDPFTIGDSECFNSNLTGCVRYSRCQAILQESLTVEPAPDLLELTCSPDMLEKNRFACEDACAPAACCWADKDSCLGQNFTRCLDYAPCQNLRRDARVIVSPLDVDALCRNDTRSGGCQAVCAPAGCCRRGTCMQNDFIACLTYAPCGGINFPPIHDVVPKPSFTDDGRNSVDRACRSDTVDGKLGYDGCTSACEPGKCCYDAATDCFDQDPLSCIFYDRCQLLNDVQF